MILYAQVINYSVTQLWIAGIYPALLAAALIAFVSMVRARRMQRTSPATGPPAAETESAEPESAESAEVEEAASTTHGVRKVVASVTGVLIPVLVVGGIYSGILTLSEVAAALVAVVIYAGLLITRIGGRRLFKAARVGAERAGAVFLIVIAARLFSNVLVEQQTIVGLLNTVSNLHLSKFLTLLLANIAMLAAGTLMDGLSLIIIGAPILYSLLTPLRNLAGPSRDHHGDESGDRRYASASSAWQPLRGVVGDRGARRQDRARCAALSRRPADHAAAGHLRPSAGVRMELTGFLGGVRVVDFTDPPGPSVPPGCSRISEPRSSASFSPATTISGRRPTPRYRGVASACSTASSQLTPMSSSWTPPRHRASRSSIGCSQ